MAIARRLTSLEPLFLTLSGAAPVVREQGFPIEYVASYSTPGAGSDWRWSRRLRGRLRAAFAEAAPDVLVFDGAHPYQGLIDALGAARGARRVWCRRPMWRPGSNRGALARESFFDAVLEPGEFAASQDQGATVERRDRARVVDPIVFCDDADLLPRQDAAAELGLDPEATCVLVNLGQGPEVRALAERCVRELAGRDGVQVAVLSSAIASGLDLPDGVVHLRATYPISRYFRAIDGAVAAAGYNAYHELIRFGIPTLFAPDAPPDRRPGRARPLRAGVGRGARAGRWRAARGRARTPAGPGPARGHGGAPRRAPARERRGRGGDVARGAGRLPSARRARRSAAGAGTCEAPRARPGRPHRFSRGCRCTPRRS